MKKLIALVFCIFFLFTSCAKSDSKINIANNGKLNVVATIFPQYDFVRSIAGDNVNLYMLIPPGSESHTYDPSPADIINIEQCDLFIYAGGSGDHWVETIIESIQSDTVFISLMDIIEPLTEQHIEGMQEDFFHEHNDDYDNSADDEHNHDEYDEHVWTSPVNADIICNKICDILCELDQKNSQIYKSRYDSYSKELMRLDSDMQNIMKNAKRNTIIFADRFPIRYFTEQYGLEYYAAFPGCASEVEPTPKTLMFLIDKVKEDNIPVVFYREFSNKKVANIVCDETNAKMLLFHSCHNITAQEFESGITYIDIMKNNISNIKEALN